MKIFVSEGSVQRFSEWLQSFPFDIKSKKSLKNKVIKNNNKPSIENF